MPYRLPRSPAAGVNSGRRLRSEPPPLTNTPRPAEVSDTTYLVLWVVVAAACAGVAGAITNGKGHGWGAGIALGAILGVIGLLIALVLPRNRAAEDARATRECPYCRQRIHPLATVCPFCQRESEPWQWHENRWWMQSEGRWYYLEKGRWVELQPSS